MPDNPEPPKIQLIRKVNEIGRQFDDIATSRAFEFARRPDCPDARRDAEMTVRVADHLQKAANEIVDQIHIFWPSDDS